MAEYIEREALITKFKKMELGEHGLVERLFADGVYAVIAAFPSADVAPVVHTHWQPYEDTVQCSACGFGTFMDGYFFVHGECTHADDRSFRFSFCPNCGAKMDEREGTQ